MMSSLRPDGRLYNEIRDVKISFDGLSGVDGSARFGFGEASRDVIVSKRKFTDGKVQVNRKLLHLSLVQWK